MSNEDTPKSNKGTCGLCNEKPSRYCCPRCEIFYCSLDCYKSEKHLECSESFYRDCVTSELTHYQASDDSKSKMIDILSRLKDDDTFDINDFVEDEGEIDSDDEEALGLEERVKGLDLNDPDAVWKVLTVDERNEFEALLNQGDVGSILVSWEPWWMYYREKKLVEETGKEEVLKCPEIKAVQRFEELTKVNPSAAIKYNITNILAAYSFIMRYFNGEVDPVEGTVYLLSICANLDCNTNFEELSVAVESVAQKCLQSDLIQTDEDSLTVMRKDTYLILRGPSEDNKKHYCKSALSNLHKILSTAKSTGKSPKTDSKTTKEENEFSRKFPEHEKEHLPNLDVTKVKKCIKKVEYYLSYLESYDMEFLL